MVFLSTNKCGPRCDQFSRQVISTHATPLTIQNQESRVAFSPTFATCLGSQKPKTLQGLTNFNCSSFPTNFHYVSKLFVIDNYSLHKIERKTTRLRSHRIRIRKYSEEKAKGQFRSAWGHVLCWVQALNWNAWVSSMDAKSNYLAGCWTSYLKCARIERLCTQCIAIFSTYSI